MILVEFNGKINSCKTLLMQGPRVEARPHSIDSSLKTCLFLSYFILVDEVYTSAPHFLNNCQFKKLYDII